MTGLNATNKSNAVCVRSVDSLMTIADPEATTQERGSNDDWTMYTAFRANVYATIAIESQTIVCPDLVQELCSLSQTAFLN